MNPILCAAGIILRKKKQYFVNRFFYLWVKRVVGCEGGFLKGSLFTFIESWAVFSM